MLDKLDNQEAIKILRKDIEEERNWRSARGRLIEVLEAAVSADALLRGHDARVQEYKATLSSLESSIENARQSLRTAQAEGLKAIEEKKVVQKELADLTALLGKHKLITELDQEIIEKRAIVSDLKSTVDVLKAQLARV